MLRPDENKTENDAREPVGALPRPALDDPLPIEFMVDELGNAHALVLERSSARVFEAAASRAVAQGKWDPGKRNGRPVVFWTALPIGLDLAGD